MRIHLHAHAHAQAYDNHRLTHTLARQTRTPWLLQGDMGMLAASLVNRVTGTVHDAVEKAASALGDPRE